MATLRSWLRRNPQPARLRVRIDDEERFVELSADARNRWKSAEESVLASRAHVVECLDGDGNTLRAQQLRDELEPHEDEGIDRRAEDKIVSRRTTEIAGVLDAYGSAINKAFDRGAAAAGVSQENLVGLVETLTSHLTMAITNLHNVSVNLANIVSQQDEPEAKPGDQVLGQLVALAAAKAVGGGEKKP